MTLLLSTARPTIGRVSLLGPALLLAASCGGGGGDTTPVAAAPTAPSTPTPSPPPPNPPPTIENLDTPMGLRVVGEGVTETQMFLDLEWNSVPETDFYRLQVDRVEEGCTFENVDDFPNANLEVRTNTHRALLRRAEHDYCFRVRAERDPGAYWSEWSATVAGRTIEGADRPPHRFRIEYDGTNSFRPEAIIYWDRVPGAHGYCRQSNWPKFDIPIERQQIKCDAYGITGSAFGTNGKHGCIREIRVCTILEEDALSKDTIECSDWSEVQEFVIDPPWEPLSRGCLP